MNDHCRTDLRSLVILFFVNKNGINMFDDFDCTSARDLELCTDATSIIGNGAYFKGTLYCSPWPDELFSPLKKKYSMAFL